MSILDKVGEFVRSLGPTAGLRSVNVLTAIDNSQVLIDGIVAEVSSNRAARAALGRMIAAPRPGNQLDLAMTNQYKAFVHGLSREAMVAERGLFFESLAACAVWMQRDLTQLKAKATTVLGAPGRQNIDSAELRMRHALAIGAISNADTLATWISFFIYPIGLPETVRPHGYQLQFVKDKMPLVLEIVNAMHQRPAHVTLVDELMSLGHGGSDVLLQANGTTVDSYAHAADYGPSAQVAMHGFIRNPLMMLTDALALWMHARYQRNKQMREWMAIKIAMLTQQLDGTDPNSDAYAEKAKILEAYTRLISDLDRKIQRYENG